MKPTKYEQGIIDSQHEIREEFNKNKDCGLDSYTYGWFIQALYSLRLKHIRKKAKRKKK